MQETLPPDIVRKTDTHALGRWCYYLAAWAQTKLELEKQQHFYETKSKQGDTLLRVHPRSKRLLELERVPVALEDRFWLNIASRHSVLNRLFANTPPAPPAAEGEDPPADGTPDSPLGYLLASDKKPN